MLAIIVGLMILPYSAKALHMANQGVMEYVHVAKADELTTVHLQLIQFAAIFNLKYRISGNFRE